MDKIVVSTPSRLCLFGEHQDYLGLEVIALAIDLRFRAYLSPRNDHEIHLSFDNQIFSETYEVTSQPYKPLKIDLSQAIVYDHRRDYLKSAVNCLIKTGWHSDHGYDIVMRSNIPIGKGMSSSTTMIIALIKGLLEATEDPRRHQPDVIAQLAFDAEVTEFNEPGGKMDHLTSSHGGLLHLDFSDEQLKLTPLAHLFEGEFILFDSLADKNTTLVLKQAKDPVLLGMAYLKNQGIESFSTLKLRVDQEALMKPLPQQIQTKLYAQLRNDALRNQALDLINSSPFDNDSFGKLLSAHHKELRDGLGLSTPAIEHILSTALSQGAYGGKINGSGGGGCCFVYAPSDRVDAILNAVQHIGYPGIRLGNSAGVPGVRREIDHVTT